MTFFASLRLFSVSLISVLLIQCGGSGSGTSDESVRQIKSTIQTVIVPSQQDLVVAADDLTAATKIFCTSPNAGDLSSVREAWKKTRLAWNATEAFFTYGPAHDLTATAALDTWPVVPADIQSVLGGTEPITALYLAQQKATARGIPVVEYLLFPAGKSDADTVAAFTSQKRRCDYVRAASEDIAEVALSIAAKWQGKDGFGAELAKAGAGSVQFPTAQAGIDTVFIGMVRAVERMERKKIAKPLGREDKNVAQPDAVEAPFATTSMEHLRRGLDSITSIYFCERGAVRDGSIGDLVALQSPSIDADIRAQFTRIKEAADAITSPLATAVSQQKPEVETLAAEVATLSSLLKLDAAGVMGISVPPTFHEEGPALLSLGR